MQHPLGYNIVALFIFLAQLLSISQTKENYETLWSGGPDPAEERWKVMIKRKLKPTTSQITCDKELERWRKTTLIKLVGSEEYRILEDRVEMSTETVIEKGDCVERMIVFCQPERWTKRNTAVRAVDLFDEFR